METGEHLARNASQGGTAEHKGNKRAGKSLVWNPCGSSWRGDDQCGGDGSGVTIREVMGVGLMGVGLVGVG